MEIHKIPTHKKTIVFHVKGVLLKGVPWNPGRSNYIEFLESRDAPSRWPSTAHPADTNVCLHACPPGLLPHPLLLRRESVAINSSLMTLGRCLEALRWNQQHKGGGSLRVVPCRESKVTHLFRWGGAGEVQLAGRAADTSTDFPDMGLF